MQYYKAIIYKDAVHRPLGTDEQLTADSIPVSQSRPNGLRVLTDGLCVGGTVAPVYVDGNAGTDATTSGSKAQPFKTLEYALTRVTATYDLNNPGDGVTILGNPTVALRAGQTFALAKSFGIVGNLTLTFWGDPQYGDWDGPLIGSPGAYNWIISDLQRPIIAPAIDPVTSNGVHRLQLYGGSVTMQGLQINLPAGSPADSDYCSFVNTAYGESGKLRMMGVIANKLDTLSTYGLFGAHSRSAEATVEAFCCQLRVQDQLIQQVPGFPAPTLDQLAARKWFFIFYPELSGAQQSGGSLVGPPGTGFIKIMWSTTPASTILGTTKQNLSSFPVYGDSAFGLGNYFYNIVRDNQGRPVNVVAPALL